SLGCVCSVAATGVSCTPSLHDALPIFQPFQGRLLFRSRLGFEDALVEQFLHGARVVERRRAEARGQLLDTGHVDLDAARERLHQIGRAHACTPVTCKTLMPSSALTTNR